MVFKLTDADFEGFHNAHDVRRIVEVALKHGVILSPHEAYKAWSDHSDDLCAGWLFLPDDDNELWGELPSWARGERE